MSKKTYSEKLRDPRWQKLRLKVMERDLFRCYECESTTETLNVHHRFYERGKDPWEYDANHLVTLCEKCHERVGGELAAISKCAGEHDVNRSFLLWIVSALNGEACNLGVYRGVEALSMFANCLNDNGASDEADESCFRAYYGDMCAAFGKAMMDKQDAMLAERKKGAAK